LRGSCRQTGSAGFLVAIKSCQSRTSAVSRSDVSVATEAMDTSVMSCIASHQRSLDAARGQSEPTAQIAAREIEFVRIKGTLQRAEELSVDVAAAIERSL
jgi:hypothetical protein